MPTENWYPISGATHDLPAGKDGFTNSGGANKNASTRVGGGRSGPATHDDDTSYIDSIAGDLQQGLNIDWPSPMAQIDTATAFHVPDDPDHPDRPAPPRENPGSFLLLDGKYLKSHPIT